MKSALSSCGQDAKYFATAMSPAEASPVVTLKEGWAKKNQVRNKKIYTSVFYIPIRFHLVDVNSF